MNGELPSPEQVRKELRLHGTAPVAQWRTLLGAVGEAVAAQDAELAARKRRHGIVTASSVALLIASFVLGVKFGPGFFAGVLLAVTGFGWAAMNRVKESLVGTERIRFTERVLAELDALVPGASVRLTAQLHESRSACEDAWLRGTLAGVRGLRLSWRCTEWRTVRLRVKRNPRGKVKSKAKATLVSRLTVRIDADRALFKAAAGPGKSATETFDLRKSRRGYVVRGWREPRWSGPIPAGHVTSVEAAREGRVERLFGEKPESLLELMRQCERWLAPRGGLTGDKP
jgi:hypothetical protein